MMKSWRSNGRECFAINCKNYQTGAKQRGISFHKFPDKSKEPTRHGEWARNCSRNKPPGDNARVCSAHFVENSLDCTGQIVRLREGAIPTIFDLPSHPINDHMYALPPEYLCPSGAAIKRKINSLIDEVEHLDQLHKNALAREKRAKTTCSNYLQSLESMSLRLSELSGKMQLYKVRRCT
uniref:THAP domain-containing protein 2-like isoform X2 n=1 Tax=Myxine glutinosa TaxID=7769 RepID=UPI00358E7D67